jgi:hypothetical protein
MTKILTGASLECELRHTPARPPAETGVTARAWAPSQTVNRADGRTVARGINRPAVSDQEELPWGTASRSPTPASA